MRQKDKSRSEVKVEVRQFFYWLKVFISPKLRDISIGNFRRKAPKWVKNQVKGSKSDQIKDQMAPDLLRESTVSKSGFP